MKKRIEVFTVSSTLSHRTKEPLVNLHFHGELAQLPPATARELGLNLIKVAEAATTDAMLWQFFSDVMGSDLTENQQTGMLVRFRDLRDKLEKSKEE